MSMNKPCRGKLLLLITCSVSLIFLTSSCAVWNWFMGGISDEEVNELDAGLSIEQRKTPFDDAFRELGIMIQAYGLPSSPIQCKNIGNETAEKGLPSNMYIMISTCINKIGKGITFIPYDVQYVVSEQYTGGKIDRIFPVAVIAGGLTGYDKELIEKERKGEIDAAWAGAQASAKYNAGESVSRVSLDLNMLDYKTQAYYPQVQAANAINLRKDKLGWAVSAYYMGCGGEFESNVKTQQGLHMALRMVVEFSVLELLGKYFRVPYWKCIKGANPDVNMIKNVKDYYYDLPEKQQIVELKRFLFIHGYKNIDRNSPTLNELEIDAFNKAKRQYGCTGMGDTLFKLWENVKVSSAIKIVSQDRKKKMAEEENLAVERQKQAKIDAAQEAVRSAREAEEIKVLQAKYDGIIAAADKYVQEDKYEKALEQYNSALQIAPNAQYPADQAAKIKAYFEQRKAAEEIYKNALAAGDALFKTKNYDKARAEYENALAARPNDSLAKGKLEEVNKLLSYKKATGVGKINEKDFNDE
ncbi:MAG TPA: hypothetical protein DCZ94_19520 [Lentisphaeria bacterium]|nr:MAG: hypothetical protein A2X48_23805 [Lentisphaerae bacterium GWF2_49_21]HBC89134.1 hypothetical protein [Lentisphaeria bacterium]